MHRRDEKGCVVVFGDIRHPSPIPLFPPRERLVTAWHHTHSRIRVRKYIHTYIDTYILFLLSNLNYKLDMPADSIS